jgi:hypothetical protein
VSSLPVGGLSVWVSGGLWGQNNALLLLPSRRRYMLLPSLLLPSLVLPSLLLPGGGGAWAPTPFHFFDLQFASKEEHKLSSS